MTKYEIEVLKKWLNEAMRQLDAEVDGQTIIPGYFDTDSSYPGRMKENGYGCGFTVMINGGVRVDNEKWESVKMCVLERYFRLKPVLPRDKELFVNVYISKDKTKPFDITFHTEFPEQFNGQTVYLI